MSGGPWALAGGQGAELPVPVKQVWESRAAEQACMYEREGALLCCRLGLWGQSGPALAGQKPGS